MADSKLTVISTDQAPAAVGPYAQAICAGGFVWCSGQIPLDPATGTLVTGSVADQTRRAITNLAAVLAASGCTLADVVKTTVYLTDMADFSAVNAVYAEMFGAARPARSCVAVAALPKGAKIELDAIAVR